MLFVVFWFYLGAIEKRVVDVFVSLQEKKTQLLQKRTELQNQMEKKNKVEKELEKRIDELSQSRKVVMNIMEKIDLENSERIKAEKK